MSRLLLRRCAPLAAVLAALFVHAGPVVHAGPGGAEDVSPEALLTQRAPAIVSLKYVLRYGEDEMAQEARGVVVDPTGIVALGNEYLGGDETKTRDVKVLFGADPKEWAGVVVARDTILGLAYVQVLGLEKPVDAVDLTQGAEPRLGQDLRSVWRDVRGFDFAPGLRRHYVAGRVEKPRKLWSLSGDGAATGLPLFDAEGRPVGLVVVQTSSSGTESDEVESRAFLLPLADALRSLEQARKRVPEAVQRAQASKPEAAEPAPAAPATPATPEQPK